MTEDKNAPRFSFFSSVTPSPSSARENSLLIPLSDTHPRRKRKSPEVPFAALFSGTL